LNNKRDTTKKGDSGAHDIAVSQALLPLYDALSKEITERKNEVFQELITQQGIEGSKLLEYTQYDLSNLANALASSSPEVFTEYVEWVAALFESNSIPLDLLKKNITIIEEVLSSFLPSEHQVLIGEYLKAGISVIGQDSAPQPTYIDPSSPHGNLAAHYLTALLSADRDRASQLILDSFRNGVSIREIYLHVLQPVQYEIGRLWHMREISVAQEHFASSVTQLVMAQLYPFISVKGQERTKGSIVAVCVSGELHEIGIRMVADFFEMEGWSTHFLGANMPVNDIVEMLHTQKADLLAVSASMSSNVLKAKNLITAVRSSPSPSIKVMVGGYTFNSVPDLWKQVGADYYAENAESALRVVRHMPARKTHTREVKD
jgi:methanogenic corrinoid protein MtbC1